MLTYALGAVEEDMKNKQQECSMKCNDSCTSIAHERIHLGLVGPRRHHIQNDEAVSFTENHCSHLPRVHPCHRPTVHRKEDTAGLYPSGRSNAAFFHVLDNNFSLGSALQVHAYTNKLALAASRLLRLRGARGEVQHGTRKEDPRATSAPAHIQHRVHVGALAQEHATCCRV
jgi:hypothetical protein